MITFACPGCGKSFSVPENLSGRKARCKGCRSELTVPEPAVNGNGHPVAAKLPVRTRRLMADARQMAALERFELIRVVSMSGDPPDEYVIEYSIKGLERGRGKEPVVRDTHRMELKLTSEYPRIAPQCRMITPIFHPNFDPSTVCVGDHWAAGERLIDLVIRVGEMIAYQAYNVKSPLDAEAAMWADLNAEKLPVDARALRVGEE